LIAVVFIRRCGGNARCSDRHSGVYRKPAAADAEELAPMRWIDQQYLSTPFYGSRRMTAELRQAGYPVNRKRVQRLMRMIGSQRGREAGD
jgi:hypothetical protein